MFVAVYTLQLGLTDWIKPVSESVWWWYVILALVEESAKLAIPFLFLKKEVRLLTEDLIKYAILGAWIFAMIENGLFTTSSLMESTNPNWLRFVLATTLHVVTTFVATLLWTRGKKAWNLVTGILVATVLHAAFNVAVVGHNTLESVWPALLVTNLAFLLVMWLSLKKLK